MAAEDDSLSATTIRNLESGHLPTTRVLLAVSRVLGAPAGELLGETEREGDPRFDLITRHGPDLDDSDIEVLAVMAKQLASARRQAVALDLAQLPGWDRAPLEFRQAAIEATEEALRAEPLRAAEEPATYRAGRPRRGSTRGRGGGPGGRSAPGA